MSSEESDYMEEYYTYQEYQTVNVVTQITDYCVLPTLLQTLKFALELIGYNLAFLFLIRIFSKGKELRYHVISTLVGLMYIYGGSFLYSKESVYVIPLVYLSYIGIIIIQRTQFNPGFFIGAFFISLLISCEFYYDHDSWLKVRGIVMVVMMKIMSVAFDLQRERKLPSVWGFSGYIWCPSNSILGPWITYKEYISLLTNQNKITIYWLIGIFKYLFMAIVFVCMSNCINSHLVSDDAISALIAYREAMNFRMSHYFVSYLASAAMLTAGFKSGDGNSYTITKPLEIEVPRSLVNVVISWNIPSHKFLKKYIFPVFKPYGQFVAVFMTFLVSSMMHGLNIEVSVVLLSLGIFSYVQLRHQDKMAEWSNACVKVRPCKECKHKYKSNSLLTRSINVVFTFFTIIYLAYLGCIMENVDTSRPTLEILYSIFQKWWILYFAGHTVAALSILVILYLNIFM